MTATYRPLPVPPARQADDDDRSHGIALLTFILECRSVPYDLADRDLELADKAAQDYATHAAGPGPDGTRLASRLEPHQHGILVAYSEARHWIAASQARRRQWAADEAQTAQDARADQHPTPGTQKGRPAPLAPQPPGKGPGSYADERQPVPAGRHDDGIRF